MNTQAAIPGTTTYTPLGQPGGGHEVYTPRNRAAQGNWVQPALSPAQQQAALALRAPAQAEDWSTERYCAEMRAIRNWPGGVAPSQAGLGGAVGQPLAPAA